MKIITTTLLLLSTLAATAQEAVKNPAAFSQRAAEAYEAKAESKVNEFFNYLSLLTDPAGNPEMKQQAATEAAKMFKSKDEMVEDFFETRAELITVGKLLEKASLQKKKVGFTVSSFAIIPKGESATRHDWLMTYEVAANNRAVQVSQGFTIQLEEKKFGSSSKKVWNSYLGELR